MESVNRHYTSLIPPSIPTAQACHPYTAPHSLHHPSCPHPRPLRLPHPLRLPAPALPSHLVLSAGLQPQCLSSTAHNQAAERLSAFGSPVCLPASGMQPSTSLSVKPQILVPPMSGASPAAPAPAPTPGSAMAQLAPPPAPRPCRSSVPHLLH